jgi:membrane protein
VFIQTVFAYVDKTNFATVGAVGLLILFWSVISLMSNIESVFNAIWRVRIPRTLVRRFQCYISLLVFVPILFLAATSITAMLSSTHLHLWLAEKLGPAYAIVQTGLQFTGLLSFIVGFSLLYLFMPNTRVQASAALAGGVCAGSAWYSWQIVCAWIQLGASRENAIYGTFAAIPIFLAWMYASWMIVLVGAEISFAFQQRDNLDRAFDTMPLSCHERILLGLVIVYDVCTAARHGHTPWSAHTFGRRHGLSDALILEIAHALAGSGLLVEVAGHPDCFVPAKDPSLFSPADVEQLFRHELPGEPRITALPGHSPVAKLFAAKFAAYTTALREQSFAELVTD